MTRDELRQAISEARTRRSKVQRAVDPVLVLLNPDTWSDVLVDAARGATDLGEDAGLRLTRDAAERGQRRFFFYGTPVMTWDREPEGRARVFFPGDPIPREVRRVQAQIERERPTS